jgi:hypothetical protein
MLLAMVAGAFWCEVRFETTLEATARSLNLPAGASSLFNLRDFEPAPAGIAQCSSVFVDCCETAPCCETSCAAPSSNLPAGTSTLSNLCDFDPARAFDPVRADIAQCSSVFDVMCETFSRHRQLRRPRICCSWRVRVCTLYNFMRQPACFRRAMRLRRKLGFPRWHTLQASTVEKRQTCCEQPLRSARAGTLKKTLTHLGESLDSKSSLTHLALVMRVTQIATHLQFRTCSFVHALQASTHYSFGPCGGH